jgi:hypothetical protein
MQSGLQEAVPQMPASNAAAVLTVPARPSLPVRPCVCHTAVDEIIDIVDGPKMITLEQVRGACVILTLHGLCN